MNGKIKKIKFVINISEMAKNIKKNLWKIYLYNFLSDFWLIAPIMIPFFESFGLTATQIFITESVYAITILLFEVPSGYLSDVIGRRKTLIIGAFFLPLGLIVYSFGTAFWMFIIAEFILAISASCRSGTGSAMIYDTLKNLKKQSDYKKIEGNAHFYARIGSGLAAISGGFFASIFLRLPFYINIFFGILMGIVAFLFVEPRRKKLKCTGHIATIKDVIKKSLKNKQIRMLIILSGLFKATMITGIWTFYMYYSNLGVPVSMYGILFAAFGFISGYGGKWAHSLEKKIGLKKMYWTMLIVSPAFFLLGIFQTLFALPLIFLIGFMSGISTPIIADGINKATSSNIRATVLSVSNMVGQISYAIFGPIIGWVIDFYGLDKAHIIIAGIFLIVGFWVISGLKK